VGKRNQNLEGLQNRRKKGKERKKKASHLERLRDERCKIRVVPRCGSETILLKTGRTPKMRSPFQKKGGRVWKGCMKKEKKAGTEQTDSSARGGVRTSDATSLNEIAAGRSFRQAIKELAKSEKSGHVVSKSATERAPIRRHEKFNIKGKEEPSKRLNEGRSELKKKTYTHTTTRGGEESACGKEGEGKGSQPTVGDEKSHIRACDGPNMGTKRRARESKALFSKRTSKKAICQEKGRTE